MRVTGFIAAGFLSGNLITGCALTQQLIPSTMSDADMIALFRSVDVMEIEGAQVARQKASSQSVRDYADRLVLEHGALLNQKQRLAGELPQKREKGPLASSLEAANRHMLKTLSNKSGSDFDRAYIDFQISMHNTAMEIANDAAIDNTLLRQQVRDARLDFIAHEAKARSIREQLHLSLRPADGSEQ